MKKILTLEELDALEAAYGDMDADRKREEHTLLEPGKALAFIQGLWSGEPLAENGAPEPRPIEVIEILETVSTASLRGSGRSVAAICKFDDGTTRNVSCGESATYATREEPEDYDVFYEVTGAR